MKMVSEIGMYLLIVNLLLLGSWALAWSILRLREHRLVSWRWLGIHRLAQALFLTAILAPWVGGSLPKVDLPRIAFAVREPAGEFSWSTQWSEAVRGGAQKVKSTIFEGPMQDAEKIRPLASLAWTLSWALFCSALLCIIGRLSRDAFFTWSLLRTACVIRRHGRVRIVVTDAATVPFSARFPGHAYVALPAAMLTPAADFRAVVRHELEHHRSGDTVWVWAIELVRALFFYNPWVHLWARVFDDIQEYSCDEALIGRKKLTSHGYGSCLVRVAEAALGNRGQDYG